jgi:uncharacterized protein YndB with AHSA1/START domain
MRAGTLLLLFVCLLSAALPAGAEVTAAEAGGFISEHTLILDATPARAYEALTAEVARWWNPDHSYSGDGANFAMDARAGGCFCESLADGGSVMHMQVVFASPGEMLRLRGGLGPLQGMGVVGAMTFAFTALEDGRTRLDYRYVVSGFAPDGLVGLAEPVDQVQLGQLERLAAYLRR